MLGTTLRLTIPKATKVWLSFDDQEQLIQEGIKCTVIGVTVHTNEKVNIIDAMIVFSQNSQNLKLKQSSLKFTFVLLGFDLNVTAMEFVHFHNHLIIYKNMEAFQLQLKLT